MTTKKYAPGTDINIYNLGITNVLPLYQALFER